MGEGFYDGGVEGVEGMPAGYLSAAVGDNEVLDQLS